MSRIVRGSLNRLRRLGSAWRRLVLEGTGVQVGAGTTIERGVEARLGMHEGTPGVITIGPHGQLGSGVLLDCWGGSIEIDAGVFVGPYTVIYGHGGVRIGRGTLIAMHCRILSSEHTIPGKEARIREQPDLRQPTTIGDDVWLGAGSTVLAGVSIGTGAVIGAGAVVTSDIPPHAVAIGVPARVVRVR